MGVKMKRIIGVLLAFFMLFTNFAPAFAIQDAKMAQSKPIVYNKNARVIKYAFVFDGPSDKNAQVLKTFQQTITRSTAPDYKAQFPAHLVFTGNWKKENVEAISNRALNSEATMVVSLGYLSTEYYNSLKNKKKFVITIDQYGLRSFGDQFFNPVSQSIKGVYAFQKLVKFKKIAVLMNERATTLNGNKETVVMYQDLGSDTVPTPDRTHKIVVKNADGTYSNKESEVVTPPAQEDTTTAPSDETTKTPTDDTTTEPTDKVVRFTPSLQ